MKKIFFMKFLLLVLIWVLVGCFNNSKTTEQDITIGTYVIQTSEDIIKSSVVLKENNKFILNYSGLINHMDTGSYEQGEGSLILKADSGLNYVFKIKDNTLIFDAKESLEMLEFENIFNGSIFSLDNDLTERTPDFAIGYDLKYREKLFPNMTDIEIKDILARILATAIQRTSNGEKFEVTEEELEILGIKGLDPQYLDVIKISTGQ